MLMLRDGIAYFDSSQNECSTFRPPVYTNTNFIHQILAIKW